MELRRSLLVVLVLLVPSVLLAGGPTCSVAQKGLCWSYEAAADASAAETQCKRLNASFSMSACPTSEVVARCTNQTGSGAIETTFYYPQWTLNLVQERCRATGGTVSQ